MSANTILFSSASAVSVDAEAGILLGVSVITEGEAKGHNLQIDSTTLSQVKACIDAFGEDGVKVKVDHWSGFDGIVGTLRSASIDGQQLRADLHLLSTHPARARIIELAETMPSQFGLSIAFSGEPESAGDVRFARCSELYSVDLVDQPAANPSGLFSSPAQLTEAELAFASALERVESLSAELATLQDTLSERQQTITSLESDLAASRSKIAEFEARHERLNALHQKVKAAAHLAPASVIPFVAPPDAASETDADIYNRFTSASSSEATRMFADPALRDRIMAESRRRNSPQN